MAGTLSVRHPRSPFTVERPPPVQAPHGCPVVIGWELAAVLWRSHLPDPLTGDATCAGCGLRMPCPCWRFADVFLAQVIEPPSVVNAAVDDATRELPRVERRPLPRRQPGAQLQAEEVRRMVYAVGLADPQPRIDSVTDCGHCGGQIVWDEVHGWLHIDGWYACRHPSSGVPREVMASPSKERP
ncbi:MAG TPA: hypothetical protein VEK77_08595 [Gemmatimonadales bacterium]|nr:hypothetical protein [Gemmatimonadales bacterium]